MAKPVISPEARSDLEQIGDYIAFTLNNRIAARNVIKRLREAINSLSSFPARGTPLPYELSSVRYRYLLVGNHFVFYYLIDETPYIDRILYARSDYLSILFPDVETE